MGSNKEPISRDSDLCEVIPPLKDKFVVDFANSFDVVDDHLQVQRSRSGFFSRLYDGFTGKGARRQADVNTELLRAAKGSLRWLTDLTRELSATNRELALHGRCLARVNDSVARLCLQVADIIGDLDHLADDLENLRKEVNGKITILNDRLRKVEAQAKALEHRDIVFSRWEDARRYDRLPALGRCYAALEELRWGPFGYYCQTYPAHSSGLLEAVANKAMGCMAADLGLSPTKRVETEAWLLPDGWEDGSAALAYLAEDYGPMIPPVVAISNGRVPSGEWSQEVPRRACASRLAEELVDEMFPSRSEEEKK